VRKTKSRETARAAALGQAPAGDAPAGDAPAALSRRDFLAGLGRWLAGLGLAGLALKTLGAFALPRKDAAGPGGAAAPGQKLNTVWQIDPDLCTACGRCRDNCVLVPSAVKCVQAYAVCGYCDLCGGYFHGKARILNTGAENQICPAAAIKRTFVEDPYFEYTILEERCVGCAQCVIGCAAFGNASLYLQIRHDRCANCNDCSIARSCPAQAISRVPRERPYRLRGPQGGTNGA
jgi:electron transport complex protein RnfB